MITNPDMRAGQCWVQQLLRDLIIHFSSFHHHTNTYDRYVCRADFVRSLTLCSELVFHHKSNFFRINFLKIKITWKTLIQESIKMSLYYIRSPTLKFYGSALLISLRTAFSLTIKCFLICYYRNKNVLTPLLKWISPQHWWFEIFKLHTTGCNN